MHWPFCEQNNTLLGFTALFTHHNYPPHFEEVGENSSGVGLLKATPHIKFHFQFSSVQFKTMPYAHRQQRNAAPRWEAP